MKLGGPLKESAYALQLLWAALKARYFTHYGCKGGLSSGVARRLSQGG